MIAKDIEKVCSVSSNSIISMTSDIDRKILQKPKKIIMNINSTPWLGTNPTEIIQRNRAKQCTLSQLWIAYPSAISSRNDPRSFTHVIPKSVKLLLGRWIRKNQQKKKSYQSREASFHYQSLMHKWQAN